MNRHHRETSFVLAASLFLLSGCIPWPHHDLLAPAITGAVRSGATPVGGATVYLNASLHDEDCHTYQLSAVADRNGEFAVGPVEEFRWIEFVYGDPRAGWTLCVDTPDGRKVLLTQGGIGRPPSKMNIQCDVSVSGVARVAPFGRTIEEGNTCSVR